MSQLAGPCSYLPCSDRRRNREARDESTVAALKAQGAHRASSVVGTIGAYIEQASSELSASSQTRTDIAA